MIIAVDEINFLLCQNALLVMSCTLAENDIDSSDD